ncbi:MAG TPA: segregation/condensation protein A [Bacillota bacterium]|nr:segregation/condensation protein A [Bacillota bacterium]
MSYTVRLPVFEGPFDLLFHLVKKAEVDIWEISIAEITGQYLAYLQSMKELNLDIASEFLVMAATLLRLKSKLLLPRQPRPAEDEEEIFDINSPEELFNRLEEYRRFKEAARFLREKELEQQKIFLRSTGGRKLMLMGRQQTFYTFWEGPYVLGEIMRRFAETAAAAAITPVIGGIEDFPVAEKMAFIYDLLERSGKVLPLKAFWNEKGGLWELIAVFIAVLELARQRKIALYQDRPFGQILLSINSTREKEQKHGA